MQKNRLHNQTQPALETSNDEILPQGNCGVTDQIYETTEKLCADKSDYQVVVTAFKSTGSPYYKELLAILRKTINVI